MFLRCRVFQLKMTRTALSYFHNIFSVGLSCSCNLSVLKLFASYILENENLGLPSKI